MLAIKEDREPVWDVKLLLVLLLRCAADEFMARLIARASSSRASSGLIGSVVGC